MIFLGREALTSHRGPDAHLTMVERWAGGTLQLCTQALPALPVELAVAVAKALFALRIDLDSRAISC
jgi:hypothetical protein